MRVNRLIYGGRSEPTKEITTDTLQRKRFFSIYEADASELLENLEETHSLYS